MKKKIKITYNSPIVLSFVLLCFIATILGIISNNTTTNLLFSVYRSSFKDPLSYIRLFLHVFGHSGMEHFIGNTMYLLLLGPLLEEKYGSKTMIRVMVVTAFVTGIIHCLFSDNSSLCGASGIVFAFILLSSFTAVKEREIPMSFILVALLFIGKEIYNGVFVDDNISNISHIIGGIIGSGSGFFLNRAVYKRRF